MPPPHDMELTHAVSRCGRFSGNQDTPAGKPSLPARGHTLRPLNLRSARNSRANAVVRWDINMDSLQPVTGAESSQRPSRSHQMIGCLRESMLYSEKRARDLLFNAVEQIVSTRAVPPIISRLARESAACARGAAQRARDPFSNSEPSSKAVIHAMLHAGVLLTANASPALAGLVAQ